MQPVCICPLDIVFIATFILVFMSKGHTKFLSLMFLCLSSSPLFSLCGRIDKCCCDGNLKKKNKQNKNKLAQDCANKNVKHTFLIASGVSQFLGERGVEHASQVLVSHCATLAPKCSTFLLVELATRFLFSLSLLLFQYSAHFFSRSFLYIFSSGYDCYAYCLISSAASVIRLSFYGFIFNV